MDADDQWGGAGGIVGRWDVEQVAAPNPTGEDLSVEMPGRIGQPKEKQQRGGNQHHQGNDPTNPLKSLSHDH